MFLHDQRYLTHNYHSTEANLHRLISCGSYSRTSFSLIFIRNLGFESITRDAGRSQPLKHGAKRHRLLRVSCVLFARVWVAASGLDTSLGWHSSPKVGTEGPEELKAV